MAQSVKIDFKQWSQFDHHSYNIMSDDFVHDRLLRVNANIIDTRGRIRLQQTLFRNQQNFNTKGQSNIWFPIKDSKSLYFQIRNKGYRIHFDNGLIAKKHLQYNLYGSIQSDRKASNSMYKVGCETISQNWKVNLRYRYYQFDKSNTLYTRWRFDYKNFTVEGIKALSLNNLNLLKNNFLFGYYNGNQTYHLRIGNNQFRNQSSNLKNYNLKDYFDHAILNYTKTINQNQRFGIQTKIDVSTGIFQGVGIVFQDYDPLQHRTLKIKFNSDMSASLSLRNKMGSYGTYILGLGINNFGTANKFKAGVQVNLNL